MNSMVSIWGRYGVVIGLLLVQWLCICCRCSKPRTVSVLIRMMEAQETYFREEVIPPFEEENNVTVTVHRFESIDSIPAELQKNSNTVILVKVPFEKSWALVRENITMPLDSFLTENQLDEFLKTYLLTSLSKDAEHYYYVPRKYETRLMVYLKSAVSDAVALWRKYRTDIHTDMKKYNGYGLPIDYMLEDDPNEWDFFDIYVAGWIWAHVPYNGKIVPRVAHRGKKYSGTSHRVIDRVFQCSGDSASVVSMKADAVYDAFHWEAVYAAAGIYNERMWSESWSGGGVWQGFSEGEVFLSFMTQLDCFFIHGTGRDGLQGYLKNPDDMGIATMPRGCSLELDKQGNILRNGTKAITTGGWWWGIPRSSPDFKLSYKLAQHITSVENQVQGCSRFGMIPVRKDVLSDMRMLFGGDWISSIYEISFRQLIHNKFTIVPSHKHYDKISNLYLDAWFDIVVDKNWSVDRVVPDRTYIAKHIQEKYQAHIQQFE